MLHDSFMSRSNTIVCPGGKMDLAMQLIFSPMILRLDRATQGVAGAQIAAFESRVTRAHISRDEVIMPKLIDCVAAVSFDLDGTLIDTAPDLGAAANMMLVMLGGRPLRG